MEDQRTYEWDALKVVIDWQGEYEPEYDDEGECEGAVVDLYGQVKAYLTLDDEGEPFKAGEAPLAFEGEINIEWEAWDERDFPDVGSISEALDDLRSCID